jgi:hypothetical protein
MSAALKSLPSPLPIEQPNCDQPKGSVIALRAAFADINIANDIPVFSMARLHYERSTNIEKHTA